MKLTYAAPPTELTPYLSAFYLFESDEPLIEDIERADIAQFRYFLKGSGTLKFPDGHLAESAPVSLMGPRMTASHVTIHGPIKVFGFGLLPAGWAAATKLHADKFVNSITDAATLFGSEPEEVRQELLQLETVDQMAAVASARALGFYDRAEKVPHWFVRATDQWLESQLSPELEDLEKVTGLSRRQIERLARQIYGAPPKLLVRKYRALRTANAIARGRGDWQDFVTEGFYDQSHCIREFKEFIGITPGAVRDHASPLTAMTFDRSNLMGEIAPLSAQT